MFPLKVEWQQQRIFFPFRFSFLFFFSLFGLGRMLLELRMIGNNFIPEQPFQNIVPGQMCSSMTSSANAPLYAAFLQNWVQCLSNVEMLSLLLHRTIWFCYPKLFMWFRDSILSNQYHPVNLTKTISWSEVLPALWMSCQNIYDWCVMWQENEQ